MPPSSFMTSPSTYQQALQKEQSEASVRASSPDSAQAGETHTLTSRSTSFPFGPSVLATLRISCTKSNRLRFSERLWTVMMHLAMRVLMGRPGLGVAEVRRDESVASNAGWTGLRSS